MVPLHLAALHDASSSHFFLLLKDAFMLSPGHMLVSIASVIIYTEKGGFLTYNNTLSLTLYIPTNLGKFRFDT